jgi:hypothetical protein
MVEGLLDNDDDMLRLLLTQRSKLKILDSDTDVLRLLLTQRRTLIVIDANFNAAYDNRAEPVCRKIHSTARIRWVGSNQIISALLM